MKIKQCLTAIMLSLVFALGYSPAVNAADPAYSDDGSEIVIRKGVKGEIYYDYRRNGEVVEIKVVPSIGKPYYLVPKDGGYIKFDRTQLLIPSWVIFSW